ncbi:MAG TPA: hypothetical protein VFF79_15630 [Conexibacter sp.]|jgi:hypothetical protein|nr:hypothetical protein [Conexibacter sp.]
MRRALLQSSCAAAAVALALPAVASAQIQVDRGIAGARLGNTVAQVHAALGAPTSVHNGSNDFGRFREERYAGGIVVDYQGARTVSSVTTTGLGDRTAKGVGVGSTEASVRANVPGVRCETTAGSRSCHTHTFTAGRRVTDFFIRGGKVTRVSLGFVID